MLIGKLRFLEMTEGSDFDLYDRLARPEMKVEDLVSGEELRRWISEQVVQAWMVNNEMGQLVGWCAVMLRSPCHPAGDSVHFLGNVVFGDRKGRGIGTAMAEWRVARFGARPLTASIQPGNLASEKVLKGCGFRPGLPEPDGPWTVWHRPADGQRQALVRWTHPGDTVGRVERDMAGSDVIHGLRQQGWWVEAAIGGDLPSVRDDCPHALWPDAAAFHAVIDVA